MDKIVDENKQEEVTNEQKFDANKEEEKINNQPAEEQSENQNNPLNPEDAKSMVPENDIDDSEKENKLEQKSKTDYGEGKKKQPQKDFPKDQNQQSDLDGHHQQQQNPKIHPKNRKSAESQERESVVDEKSEKTTEPTIPQNFEPLLVQKAEKLPPKSEKRLKVLEIVPEKNDLVHLNDELFQNQQIAQIPPSELQPFRPDQLLSCSSATIDLASSDLFDFQDNDQNQHLEMLLNSSLTKPNFGEIDLGIGELVQVDMSMTGIASSIEKALDKKTSATSKKGCEMLTDFWREANKTAREIAVQESITLRQHSANTTKQNMYIIDNKRKIASKAIDMSKEVAFKDIEAKVKLGEKIIANQSKKIENQQKLLAQQLDNVHKEHIQKIEMVKEMINSNKAKEMKLLEKDIKQIDDCFKLNREKIRKDHDQKLGTLADSKIALLQQGEKERMKHDSCTDKDILANRVGEKKLDYEHALAMKQEENKFALEQARLTLKLKMEQMKSEQNSSVANSLYSSQSQLSLFKGVGQKQPTNVPIPTSSAVACQQKRQMAQSHGANMVNANELDEKEYDESMELKSDDEYNE